MAAFRQYKEIQRTVAREFPLFSHALVEYAANRITNELRRCKQRVYAIDVSPRPYDATPDMLHFGFVAGGVNVFVRFTLFEGA